MKGPSLPLHHCHVHKLWATVNRTYSFLSFLAIAAIFYYRGAFFFTRTDPRYYNVPFMPWLLVFAAELLLAFLWLLKQPIYWRPVTRTVFPERLPKDEDLLGIDVFICTADPDKEPTLEVMNTVISAMTLDYPADKLNVYLSDDGGASVTLMGMKEAWVFATWWLPFCRRYNVKSICPQAYFGEPEQASQSKEFIKDREIIKEKYEFFKQQVLSNIGRSDTNGDTRTSRRDHPALIEVIDGNAVGAAATSLNREHVEMPLLVYVAREKRPSHPHNFKAGALNVLLKVSSMLSNSPYFLVLDCDMYCNDSMSARQAMCFYLDPKFSQSLGWVQFPQKFHNICESDIYDSQMRTIWPILWRGADGLQGPVISGTNVYIKREAICDINTADGNNLGELKNSFGPSNEFIKSLGQIYKPNVIKARELSSVLLQQCQLLASCTYEKGTKWGDKVGYRYDSIVEDVMTSFFLQTKGWRSVYLSPPRPQFLGSAAINLDDSMIQGIRWFSGTLSNGLSEYSPLRYGPSKMQFLSKMFNSWLGLFPLYFFPYLCFSTIPPLCLLHGIPIYPKAKDPFFIAFAFVFISSLLKQICEVYISGGSVRAWLNEERIFMIKAVTCYVYGSLDCIMTKLGLREASFIPTNKAGGDDRTKYYLEGKYDFRTSNMFLVPIVTLVVINLTCFVGAVTKVIVSQSWDALFAQVLLVVYVLVISIPVIEGMVLRRDSGRIPSSSTFISMMVSIVFLTLGYVILLH